jgi:hypothetical protein
MELSTIDYILIAFIIAILIHLLFTTIENTQELMTGTNLDNTQINLANLPSIQPPVVVAELPPVVVAKLPPVVQVEHPPVVHVEQPPVIVAELPLAVSVIPPVIVAELPPVIQTKNTITSYIEQTENDVDAYIQKIVYSKNKSETNEKLSAEEIQGYKNDFWNFQDNVNKNSSAGVDMVDKINELYKTGNNELINNNGKRIGDLFNGLVETDKNVKGNFCGKSLNVCLPLTGSTVKSSNTGNYLKTDEKSNYFTNFNWRYNNDNVNNGGKFYNSIEGNDSSSGNDMAL